MFGEKLLECGIGLKVKQECIITPPEDCHVGIQDRGRDGCRTFKHRLSRGKQDYKTVRFFFFKLRISPRSNGS